MKGRRRDAGAFLFYQTEDGRTRLLVRVAKKDRGWP